MKIIKSAVSEDDLALINQFSRAELSGDDVYSFNMVCCDTNIDRDGEAFTKNALQKLAELFVGKTVITNHIPKAENQIARIYKTHVEENDGVSTLIAMAYIPKDSGNDDFIKLIDSGIVKEVSVGCSIKQCTCSICGKDLRYCSHRKFKDYDGKTCYGILDDITDAYEVSFVAVPAQKGAGVTKQFSMDSAKDDIELRLRFAENFIFCIDNFYEKGDF